MTAGAESMEDLARLVGPDGAVAGVGAGSRGDLGGSLATGTRRVGAPVGVRAVRREELTVTVGAGTSVADLAEALAEVGQWVAFPDVVGPPGPAPTVGGALAVGWSSVHAPVLGPLRDALLGARCVDSLGRVLTVGGATVKNVSGYDLCRLLVGSLGTLAVLGEVTLRTRPLWRSSAWLSGEADPGEVDAAVPSATAVLWDGHRVHVHLAGHPGDVEAQAAALARIGVGCRSGDVAGGDGAPAGGAPAGGAGPDPTGGGPFARAALAGLAVRRSMAPSALRGRGAVPEGLPGRWVAEWRTGVVHLDDAAAAALGPIVVPERVARLHRSVKARFDPTGRLAPGRDVLAGVEVRPDGR